MTLHESGENYIETIYLLKKSMKDVRSIDVAQKLNYTKASISRAMGLLKRAGIITIDRNGYINFTQKGSLKAKLIYERHMILTKYLMLTLNLDEEFAEKDACKIEHVISKETFEKIREFVTDKEKQ